MDTSGSPEPTPHVGRSFAWRSLAVFLLVGTLSHLFVRDVVDDHFREALDFHARFIVTTTVGPVMAGSAGGTETSSQLEQLVDLDEQLVSLRVLGPDGETVAAAGPVTVPGEGKGDVDVTTLPVAPAEGISVRVVQDATASRAAARRLTTVFDGILIAGLLGLWIVLLPMASRLNRRLRSRAAELERQRGELRRLLDREQETVARLQELSELKDSFLSAVSHELRTPLTVVIGTLMTLRRRQNDLTLDQRCDLLSRGERSAKKLDHLLTGLLDLDRSGRTRHRDRETLDLRRLVAESAEHLPPRPLELELEAETIVADPVQMERVLANLIGNAIRHAPGGDPVVVRNRRDGDSVELVVADRGPGVPDELKQAVFEPFRQGPIADAHSPGTGIGLSLVARFVGEHGGRTWVEDRPGGGASFHLRLPQPPSVGGGTRPSTDLVSSPH